MENLEDNFKELEYKYRADKVKLSQFENFIENLKETYAYADNQEASSWDMYYEKRADDFKRFRNGSEPELTRKYKTSENNNWEREEVDLPLDPKRIKESTVTKFVGLDGYKLKRKIFKSCFIHWFDLVNFVYYTVYDSEMCELGRFIEVEINKKRVNELGDQVYEVLKEHEKNLIVLGISPANRMRKSLYELYIKDYTE